MQNVSSWCVGKPVLINTPLLSSRELCDMLHSQPVNRKLLYLYIYECICDLYQIIPSLSQVDGS